VGPALARKRFPNARRATPWLRTEGINRTCPTVADNGYIPIRLKIIMILIMEEISSRSFYDFQLIN